MNSPRILPNMPRAHSFALFVALLLGLIACAIGTSGRKAYGPVLPQEWQQARGPVVPHDTFPLDCAQCHAGSTWHEIKKDFQFDHGARTGHVLAGAHTAAECLRCHNDRGPVADFDQRGCVGCHEDQHFGKLGADCATCHTETNWLPKEQIARHARTRFPLVGSHATAACTRCHPGADVGTFDRADRECIACHTDDLARATNPDHAAQGWTDTCDRCHIPTQWTGAAFNHSAWSLTGAHASAACESCHVDGVFAGTPTNCAACHQDNYDGAKNPNHPAAGFSTDCAQCHGTDAWDRSIWPHSAWKLNGAHRQAECNACHGGNVFDGTPSACIACHKDDYNGTTDPNHVIKGFSQSCEQCHGTSAWKGGVFTHEGITSGCLVCHQDDYDGTSNPDHAATGISTTCEDCHSTRTWAGASFNHRGIRSGCVRCHLDDFTGASDPNHVSEGYPQTCELCHDTNNWDNGHFTHNQFQINSGRHSNLTCAQCHPIPRNYSSFTCTDCHAHTQPQMDKHHARVRGYVYNSSACFSCHD